jgi:hypothetical protein
LCISHFLNSPINITKMRSLSTFNTWFSTNIISDREFTATPCQAWHLGPDATLLIILRRRRMQKIVYLVPCTSS